MQIVALLVLKIDAVEIEPAHAGALTRPVNRLVLERAAGAVTVQQLEAPVAVLDVDLMMSVCAAKYLKSADSK